MIFRIVYSFQNTDYSLSWNRINEQVATTYFICPVCPWPFSLALCIVFETKAPQLTWEKGEKKKNGSTTDRSFVEQKWKVYIWDSVLTHNCSIARPYTDAFNHTCSLGNTTHHARWSTGSRFSSSVGPVSAVNILLFCLCGIWELKHFLSGNCPSFIKIATVTCL